MTNDARPDGPPATFFHDDSGAVRFWVRTPDGGWIGAMIRQEVLHYRFRAPLGREDALKAHAAHLGDIERAVLRRLAAGSREPVILRESDFDA